MCRSFCSSFEPLYPIEPDEKRGPNHKKVARYVLLQEQCIWLTSATVSTQNQQLVWGGDKKGQNQQPGSKVSNIMVSNIPVPSGYRGRVLIIHDNPQSSHRRLSMSQTTTRKVFAAS